MTDPRSRVFLLTGVTGFLGKVLLEELVRRGDELGVRDIGVVIRPRAGRSAVERFRREVKTARCFSGLGSGWTRHITILEGDLEQPGLALSADALPFLQRVTHIIHAAASVKFDLPLARAARANVTASLNTLDIAHGCPLLERFVYVSTAYVTPDPGGGPIEEVPVPLPATAAELYAECFVPMQNEAALLARTGHPNSYTLTKTIAEGLLMERRGTMPLSIVRPSVMTAARVYPFPGWIDSTAGYAAFVMLAGAGHLRALVCRPEARLDLVPVDDVTRRVANAAVHDAGSLRITHAVAGVERAPTIAQCWDVTQRFFRIHRVDRVPNGRYFGPRGVRFAIANLVQHRVPIAMARLQSPASKRRAEKRGVRLAYLNDEFSYFTTRTFNFRTSAPLDTAYEPVAFLETVCTGVHRHLFGRDDAKWVLAGRADAGRGGDTSWALRQPRGNGWVRASAWLARKTLRRIADSVTVDVPSFERARLAMPPGATLVITPSHRSYLDFVLVAYLAFARPELLPFPHFAATTDFARIPLIGRVFAALHAFYIRRGGGKDPELAARVGALLDEGSTLAFFIEGTRSRTGAFLEPRRGLLRCLQGTGRTCALLPIALSYDRVPEQDAFARENAGQSPTPMTLGGAVRWLAGAWRGRIALGRVHVVCGAPVILNDRSDVHAVSHRVVEALSAAMPSIGSAQPQSANDAPSATTWGTSAAPLLTEVNTMR